MNDEPQTRPNKHQPKHMLPEHAPTVIHDPAADETVLARWFRESLEKGPKFWLPVALGVIALVAAWVIVANLSSGRSSSSRAWEELILAKGADDRVKVGQSATGLPASWALLQAAEARYQEAFGDLPGNRDAALPLLSNAHDLFKQAYEKAPADSAPKRLAALGMARALEARGDLEGAIQQYQSVAKAWPSSDEGKQAEKLAALLKTPEAVAFYQQFSSYKPPEMTLPPRGRGSFNFPGMPGLPAGHPALDGPTIPASGLGTPEAAPPLSSPASSEVPPPNPEPPKTTGAPADASPTSPLPPQPFAGETAKP